MNYKTADKKTTSCILILKQVTIYLNNIYTVKHFKKYRGLDTALCKNLTFSITRKISQTLTPALAQVWAVWR